MTVSQELREWAMYSGYADMCNLGHAAWEATIHWRLDNWGRWFSSEDHARTFALFVACALEDE